MLSSHPIQQHQAKYTLKSAAICASISAAVNIHNLKAAYRSAANNNGDCPNHLDQNFDQKAPDLVWASDITYIKANGKWYYLCIIIDLFSRKVISWKISSRADADLVIEVFKKAYAARGCPRGLMFHSDRGTQYTSYAFRKVLDECNVVQSFSKIVHHIRKVLFNLSLKINLQSPCRARGFRLYCN